MNEKDNLVNFDILAKYDVMLKHYVNKEVSDKVDRIMTIINSGDNEYILDGEHYSV